MRGGIKFWIGEKKLVIAGYYDVASNYELKKILV